MALGGLAGSLGAPLDSMVEPTRSHSTIDTGEPCHAPEGLLGSRVGNLFHPCLNFVREVRVSTWDTPLSGADPWNGVLSFHHGRLR